MSFNLTDSLITVAPEADSLALRWVALLQRRGLSTVKDPWLHAASRLGPWAK